MSCEAKVTFSGSKNEADLLKTTQEKTTPDKIVPAGLPLVPDALFLETAQQSKESVKLGYCARFQTRIANIIKSICNSLAKLPLIGRFFTKAELSEEESLRKLNEEAKRVLSEAEREYSDAADQWYLLRFNKMLDVLKGVLSFNEVERAVDELVSLFTKKMANSDTKARAFQSAFDESDGLNFEKFGKLSIESIRNCFAQLRLNDRFLKKAKLLEAGPLEDSILETMREASRKLHDASDQLLILNFNETFDLLKQVLPLEEVDEMVFKLEFCFIHIHNVHKQARAFQRALIDENSTDEIAIRLYDKLHTSLQAQFRQGVSNELFKGRMQLHDRFIDAKMEDKELTTLDEFVDRVIKQVIRRDSVKKVVQAFVESEARRVKA